MCANNQGNVTLTIAVPVYNVEPYLKRCLDSLVNQKYQKKEILIVNDGSSDNSLAIIKSYAKKYNYIRYIDQTNKGLAYVRNVCVKEAKGKYISFIDSDDFVLDDLYEHLMPIVERKNVDIMCFGVLNLYENSKNKLCFSEINKKNEILKLYSSVDALDEFFLPNNIDVITCNKIIKKSLYDGIDYPQGKLYEDMFTNYKIISKSKTILCSSNKYYVYCHRASSIGGMKFNDKTMDLYKAVTEVYNYINSVPNKNRQHLNSGYATWLVVVLNIMIRSNHYDLNYIKLVKTFVKEHINEICKDNYLNLTRKIQFILLAFSYPLYKIFYKGFLGFFRK